MSTPLRVPPGGQYGTGFDHRGYPITTALARRSDTPPRHRGAPATALSWLTGTRAGPARSLVSYRPRHRREPYQV